MSGLTRYSHVRIAAWDCVSAAGDAAASSRACLDARSALRLRPGVGWCGALGGGPGAVDPADAALASAARPWAAISGLPGIPALGAATSKGDLGALDQALSGRHARLGAAFPGLLDARLARSLGIRAFLPCSTAAACSTGLYALLAAADLIERGDCAQALVGAADAALPPWVLAGFAALGVLCGDAHPLSAPGHGFAPGEGAGFVALARQGGWRLVAGVRLGDAGHETRFRDPRTLATCLAGLWAALPDPDLIVVHGTGTALGDDYERRALADGPWAACPRLACKPVIGHCLGASGMVELALALEAGPRRMWKLSLGFGGHLAAVAASRAG